MRLYEAEIDLQLDFRTPDVFERLAAHPQLAATDDMLPIRFVVAGTLSGGRTSPGASHCEVGFLSGLSASGYAPPDSIFRFRRRLYENQERFNAVFLVPTGIGAKIGGHSGDACPAARTLAAVCDRLIVHPNVVNASDINEMSANMLYVEGSVISRLLMGVAGLMPVRSNRILTVVHLHDETIAHLVINAVNAARAAGGFHCTEILPLPREMRMTAQYSSSGRATGTVSGVELLCDLVARCRGAIDAVAIATVVDVRRDVSARYYDPEGDRAADIINPWGGVEALLTHGLSTLHDIPTAHSPMYEDASLIRADPGVMEPAKAAEGVSISFMHCLFKGLGTSPRIITDPAVFGRGGVIAAEDISCLIVPAGCLGLPVLAALHQGIAVIEVRDNSNVMQNCLQDLAWAEGQFFQVGNYLEAAGMIAAMRAGVARDTLERPLHLARGSHMVRERKQEELRAARRRLG